MTNPERILIAIARAWSDPLVRHSAAWATLAAVLTDIALGLVPAQTASLIGALQSKLRGWPGAILVGLLHPLLIGSAAVVLLLASTRLAVLLRVWPVSGLVIGVALALFVMLVGNERRPFRLLPVLLVGLAMTLAARLTALG